MTRTPLLALLALGCRPVKVPAESASPPGETAETGDSGSSHTDEHTAETADTGETGDTSEQVPPALPSLFLNEILPGNAFTNSYETDIGASVADWIELYNAGEQDVGLGGLCITDTLDDPCLHELSAELVVPARGHLVLWADDAPDIGPEHLGFRLNEAGEAVGLFLGDSQPIDQIQYGSQVVDWSIARVPDGSTTWEVGVEPTPEAHNGAGEGEADLPGPDVEEVPAAEDLSEIYYNPESMVEVGLELSAEALASLEDEPYTWVQGSFTHEGRTYAPVAVRVKGENSYLPISQKSSMKVKFDTYVSGGVFLGMQEITLNNMSNDYSMMHERVAYWVYRNAGLPAARANHAWVTMNGEDYGLFTNLETVDEYLIGRWFEDNTGTLYEVHDVDFEDVWVDEFTLELGEDDRSNLQGLADAMEEEDPDLAWALAAEHLSIESWQLFWAVGAVVGQFDSYPYGYPGDDCHVYDDPTTGVLHFLPHGVDETFYSESQSLTSVYGILAEQCLASETCTDEWVDTIWRVQTISEEEDILAFAERVQAQIQRYVRQDPNKPYELETVEDYQDAMLEFIEERAGDLEDQIGPRP